MSTPAFPPLPSSLKAIQHYMKIALEYDKRDPSIAYWCRLYALQQGLVLDAKSKEALTFLTTLMTWLENVKKNLKSDETVANEIVAQAHVENHALKLFFWADSEDRLQHLNKNVVKAFYTAGMLLEVCSTFGEASEEIAQQKKYAKWRAAHLNTCLKTGEPPQEPAPKPDEENLDELENEEYNIPTSSVGANLVENISPVEEPKPTSFAAGYVSPQPEEIPTYHQESQNPSLTAEQLTHAQKLCKYASSALTYEDIPTAVDNLEKALRLLKTERVEDPNAWKPKHASKSKEKDAKEGSETDELLKVVRGILNKITPSKYDKLLETFKELNIETEDQLSGVIKLFFEKAVDEPIFSSTYAKMCLALSSKEVASKINEKEKTSFRKLLLGQCQSEFEKDSNGLIEVETKKQELEKAETEEKKKELKDALEDLVNKNRRKSLGNIRFIGELFKLRILSAKIMHKCIVRLLAQPGDEESLEALCRLLSTIGKELENPATNASVGRSASNSNAAAAANKEGRETMNGYFLSLDGVVKNRKTSNRIRFMIQDVIDLRKSGWKPRREDNNPKTIEQIHKEVIREREEQERERENPNYNQSMGGSRDRPGDRRGDRNDRDRKGQRGGPTDDGWNTVNSGRNNPKLDMKQLRIPTSQTTSETGMMLGPGGRASWGRGASGGMSQSMSMSGPGGPTNRYHVLEDDSGAPSSLSQDKAPFSGRASMGGPPNRHQEFRAPMPGHNKNAFYSKDGDRDRQMDGGRPQHGSFGRSRSQQSSRESSVTRSVRDNPHPPVSREISKEIVGKPNVSDDEIERKAASMLGEYFSNENLEDVVMDMKDWLNPNHVAKFINQCIMHVLESKSKERKQTGVVLKELIKKKLVSSKDILEGFSEVLQSAEDFIVDIPKFWEYLAELIEPLFNEGGLSLAFLGPFSSSISSQMASNLLAAVFKELVKSKGDVAVVERLWSSANVQLDSILPQGVDANKFARDHNLEFLSKSDFKSNLEQYLRTSPCPEDVLDWIQKQTRGEMNVTFIRALATAVTESCIEGNGTDCKLNIGKFKLGTEVLKKCVENIADRELQVLFAVQSLVTKRQHPKGLIQSIFEILYDSNVVSEDGFETWVNIDDPSEREGKALSLKSITSFLTWLKEAEPESDQEMLG